MILGVFEKIGRFYFAIIIYASKAVNELKRIDHIDTLKGIGILLVVIGHHLLGVEFLIKWINSFHMPMFFAISGFLYSDDNNRVSFCEFFKRKFKSLMYPYFTLSTVVLLWHFVWYGLIYKNTNPETTTLKVFYLTISTYGYHAFWFIPCLFCSLLLFYLVRKSKHWRVWLTVLTVVTLVVYCFVEESSQSVLFYVYRYIMRTLIATSFVWLGYEFKRMALDLSKKQEKWMFFTSLFISALFFALIVILPDKLLITNLAVLKIGHPIIFYVTSLSNSIWLFLFSKRITGILQKSCAFLGKNSIIVLALHMDISIEFAWAIVNKVNLPVSQTVNSAFAIVLEMIILAFVIVLINKFFKWLIKYPTSKMSRSLVD